MLTDLSSSCYLWSVVVAAIRSPDGESPVLVPGLVLLLHVAGLVPHTVAVLQGGQTEAGVLLAGAALKWFRSGFDDTQ